MKEYIKKMHKSNLKIFTWNYKQAKKRGITDEDKAFYENLIKKIKKELNNQEEIF
jgi:hypothetical protein